VTIKPTSTNGPASRSVVANLSGQERVRSFGQLLVAVPQEIFAHRRPSPPAPQPLEPCPFWLNSPKKEDESGGSFRSEAEVRAAAQELSDRIWYERSLKTRNPDAGTRAVQEEMEVKYGRATLARKNDHELAAQEGRLEALRWCLGCEWDELAC
jgi:hypothetical protein